MRFTDSWIARFKLRGGNTVHNLVFCLELEGMEHYRSMPKRDVAKSLIIIWTAGNPQTIDEDSIDIDWGGEIAIPHKGV